MRFSAGAYLHVGFVEFGRELIPFNGVAVSFYSWAFTFPLEKEK